MNPTTSPAPLALHDQLENSLVRHWLELTGMGCVVIDAQAQVVMLNQSAAKFLGVDASITLGGDSLALGARLTEPDAFAEFLRSPNNQAQWLGLRRQPTGRLHLLFKSRRIAWPSMSALGSSAFAADLPAENSQTHTVLSITDISQVIQAQSDLASHERRWQAMHAGVVLVSVREPDMPIVYVNAAFEHMTGYSASECLGRNCRFLQGELSQQEGLDDIRRALIEKRNGYAVLRNFRKDGSEFLNELFISPVHDDEGKLTHFLGVQHLRMPGVWGKPTQPGVLT